MTRPLLLAFVLCLLTLAVQASEKPPRGMVTEMMDWIAGQTDYHPAPPPKFVILPKDDMNRLAGAKGDWLALYGHGMIYFREGWTPRTLYGQSTLLHELVHHMQAMNGARFACREESEKQAYRLSDIWLRERGSSLEGEGFDPLFIAMISVCPSF